MSQLKSTFLDLVQVMRNHWVMSWWVFFLVFSYPLGSVLYDHGLCIFDPTGIQAFRSQMSDEGRVVVASYFMGHLVLSSIVTTLLCIYWFIKQRRPAVELKGEGLPLYGLDVRSDERMFEGEWSAVHPHADVYSQRASIGASVALQSCREGDA